MRCFPQSPKEGGLWGGALAAWEVGVWDGAGLILLGKNRHLTLALQRQNTGLYCHTRLSQCSPLLTCNEAMMKPVPCIPGLYKRQLSLPFYQAPPAVPAFFLPQRASSRVVVHRQNTGKIQQAAAKYPPTTKSPKETFTGHLVHAWTVTKSYD